MSYDCEAVRPLAGTIWAWEPRKPHAAALIEVTEVGWNGEEWWVRARILAGSATAGRAGREYLNELDRFWEACHRVSKNPGPAGYHPDAVRRRGAPAWQGEMSSRAATAYCGPELRAAGELAALTWLRGSRRS